jgi:DNA (cytosine-5)-methyltransferase 1
MRDLRILSLFTGAGGLDYGFEAAGFQTKLAIELNPDACATLMKNRPEWNVLQKGVESVSGKELTDALGKQEKEIDLIIGGPPCQPFSKAGYGAKGGSMRLDDPRSQTLSNYMRIVGELLPRAFVMENVPGICYSGKDEAYELIKQWIKKINREKDTHYLLSHKIVNAAEYGVPQIRNRFFLIGDRDGLAFEFPKETHRLQERTSGAIGLEGPVTAWDAIGDLNDEELPGTRLSGNWKDLLPSIPEGQNYLWHTNKGGGLNLFGYRTRFWGFLLKLAKDRPSWTIQAQPGPSIGPFHWKNRRLTGMELARLQTFPDGIEIEGSRLSVQKQIGNAVPSLMAEVIARELAIQIFEEKGTGTNPTLKVELKRPFPPEEPVFPVCKKYKKHIGKHAAHPGIGRGPGSVRNNEPCNIT